MRFGGRQRASWGTGPNCKDPYDDTLPQMRGGGVGVGAEREGHGSGCCDI